MSHFDLKAKSRFIVLSLFVCIAIFFFVMCIYDSHSTDYGRKAEYLSNRGYARVFKVKRLNYQYISKEYGIPIKEETQAIPGSTDRHVVFMQYPSFEMCCVEYKQQRMVPLFLGLDVEPVGKSLQSLLFVVICKMQIEVSGKELLRNLFVQQCFNFFGKHLVRSPFLFLSVTSDTSCVSYSIKLLTASYRVFITVTTGNLSRKRDLRTVLLRKKRIMKV